MKKYEIIMQDEWNNLYRLGIYNELKDSIQDINDWLDVYDFQIKEDDLKAYTSTFGEAIDLDIGMLCEERDDLLGLMVRGFVLYEDEDTRR